MAFTVFQDADDVAPLPPASLPPLAIEKENLHPLTGLRAGPTAPSDAKKRKTAALAAKPLPAPPPKKHRELKPEPKKTRKPLSTRPRSADTAKSVRACRKASPLPPVAEEHDAHRQLPRLSTAQVDINSRCYELTVSPLADVSEAYDATSQESDVRAEKENSSEPRIRDRPVVDTPLPTSDAPSPTHSPSRPPADLSTPERKRIYAAFTFSSPSPTSARFKQAQPSPS